MKPLPIPVLITCADKDQELLPLVMQRLKAYGLGLGRILVVSPRPPTPIPGLPIDWIHDDRLPLKQAQVLPYLGRDAALGWWWQQLVKLLMLHWWPQLGSRLLVWDSESLLLKPLRFQDARGRVLLHPASELHAAYTAHLERLVPGLKRWHPRLSGITHWILLDRWILEDLIQRVEQHWQMPFWQAFLAAVSPEWRLQGGASEYDLYFNFALQFHPNRVRLRQLPWRVSGALCEAVNDESNAHYVTLHRHLRDQADSARYYRHWCERPEGRLPEDLVRTSLQHLPEWRSEPYR